MSTPREKRVLCLSALSFLCLSNTMCLAGAAEESVCPSVKSGQIVHFDNTTITFDSVPSKISEDATKIIYCVKFAKAAHEYLVDWSGINLKDVFTDKGYVSTSLTVSGVPVVGGSIAYVGANRTDFSLGILKEQSWKDAGGKAGLRLLNWVSSFRGSVSTTASGQPEPARQEKLQPVDLEFTSEQSKDGAVTLRYVNHARESKVPIGFSPPPEIARNNEAIPQNIVLAAEPGELHYKVDPANAVHKVVAVTLHNSDHQDIASVPVVVVVDPER
jgi:hypothetical protein